jgi:hypothetical protein
MSKFSRLSDFEKEQAEKFVRDAVDDSGEYPWNSTFVKQNQDITKTFSITLSLERYTKLDFYQKYIGERSRSAVVNDLLSGPLENIIDKIVKGNVKK